MLYHFGDEETEGKTAFPIGSLGPEVSPDFNKTFDIVIGNPPWTRLRDHKDENTDGKAKKSATNELNKQFTAIGRRVLAARGLDEMANCFQNPDKNPDLPFLWRAMEWAKDNGVIALAMPARLFGRTSGKGFEAWRAVLHSVEITGLINGADLRKTAVWDGMDIPFCVFFARNRKPESDHRFHYSAPSYERELNGRGRFRIDYESAQPLSVAQVENQPWLLKTLALGTWLDVEVMGRLMNPEHSTLINRWREWDGTGTQTGEGYNRAAPSEKGPGSPQTFVKFLAKLPVFKAPAGGFEIEFDNLQTYEEIYGANDKGEVSANMPRRKQLFQPPLVIIPQSPGDNPYSSRAFIASKAIAFSKSNYGYSCAGHPESETLASLIYLLPHSTLFAYFCLMISRRSGFDRQTFNKEEFDTLPFPDIAKLASAVRATIRSLAKRLQHDVSKPWQEMNEFIFRLYGFDADAVQVAEDTLFAAASYRRAGKAALDQTTRNTRSGFVQALRHELEPFFDVCGERVAVREAEFQPDTWREPWFFFAVCREAETVSVNPSLMRKAMEAANKRGSSRIIVHASGKRGLLIGLLNQRRWWTVTRARLCAQHIIRERLGACGLPEHA